MSEPTVIEQLKTKFLYFLNKYTIKKNMQFKVTASEYQLVPYNWTLVNLNSVAVSGSPNISCKITKFFDKPIAYIIINTDIQAALYSNYAKINLLINGKLVKKEMNIPYVTGSIAAIPTLQLYAGPITPSNKLEMEIYIVYGNIMMGPTVITYLEL